MHIRKPCVESVAIRPEIELLLVCSRADIPLEISARIKTLISEGLDWAYVIDTAGRQGILPLLYHYLSTNAPTDVPTTVMDKLRNSFHGNTARNMFLCAELLKILAFFQENGIEAILYKGPVLAEMAYGNVALRRFADLDIVIREKDLQKAKQLLLAHGYRSIFNYGRRPLLQLTESQEAAYLKFNHEYEFLRHDGRVNIDLHWRLSQKCFPFTMGNLDQLWSNQVKVSLAGVNVATFAREYMIVLLCMHGAKDEWKKLGWISDIDHLLNNREVDWATLLTHASRLHYERVLFLGLLLANRLLGTKLPPDVLRRIEIDASLISIAAEIRNRLFEEIATEPSLMECFNLKRLHIELCERRRDRYRYVLCVLMTPGMSEWSWIKLPDSLYAAYYIMRPLRMMGRYLKVLFVKLI